MIRSFALLMLMLLTACGSAIDVQYQSRTDEKADILPRLTKTVETKTIYNSPLPLRDSYTAYSHNDIDKCFNPEIRAGKYDSLGTKLYITKKKPNHSLNIPIRKSSTNYAINMVPTTIYARPAPNYRNVSRQDHMVMVTCLRIPVQNAKLLRIL